MAPFVNVGQEKTYGKRNKKPLSNEDGEREAGCTRCQRREQHQRQAKENSYAPNVRLRAHSSFIIRGKGIH
jgi:hypothetical protein